MFSEEKNYTFFNAYLCHVCKNKESFTHATPCFSCKLIAYCSEEHKKADTEYHNSICKTARSICRKLQKDDVFEAGLSCNGLCDETNSMPSQAMPSKSKWFNVKVWVAKSITDILKRQLDQYEKRMIFLPRHCAVCFTRNVKKELVCTKCFGASYCSLEHQTSDNHEEVCLDLERTLNADLFVLHVDLKSFPIPLIPPDQAVNLNLDAYDMKTFIANYIRPGLKFEEEALISFFYTSALTFAHTVNRIPNFTLRKELTVHIVGATGPCEGHVLRFWENLLHLFPKVCALTLVHIGPDIDGPPFKLELCDDCKNAKKSVDILVYGQRYHEAHRSSSIKKPDVIIAYNSGLFCNPARFDLGGYGRLVGYHDSWEQSFPFLFQYDNVPVILTEKSKDEAELDLERLLTADVIFDKEIRVVVNCEQNPFNNLRPWNIWTSEDLEFFTKNSYVSVLIAERN